MKQLSLPNENNTTELISDDSHVGIEYVTGTKGMLMRIADYEYIGVSSNLCTRGNWVANSKKEYAEKTIKDQRSKVFLFDSGIELLGWLIK